MAAADASVSVFDYGKMCDITYCDRAENVAAARVIGLAKVRKRTWKSGGETKTAWIADYTDQHGKRHIKTFERKKDADGFLVGARHEVAEGTHTASSGSITVAEAADLWLDACEAGKLERSTMVSYRNHVRHHIKPTIGDIKLSELGTPRVEKFKNDLLVRKYADDPTQTLSRAMAKKVLTSLKQIIKNAERLGAVARNAAAPVSITLDRQTAHKKIRAGRDFPTKEEINALLAAAEGKWRPLIVTAIFTGMRSSELRGLTWENVDFDNRVIHVRERADAWNVVDIPKSEAGERTIQMTPLLLNTLKEWKLACPKVQVGKDAEGNPITKLQYVFPNGEGKIENHANIANRGWLPLQVKAGVARQAVDKEGTPKVDKDGEPIMKGKYGFHCTRHFFASWLIDMKAQPKKVQTLLGHASLQMSYDLYGHLFPSEADDHAFFADGEKALFALRDKAATRSP